MMAEINQVMILVKLQISSQSDFEVAIQHDIVFVGLSGSNLCLKT